jgi:ABC-type arginine transport system ATPase subunit
VAAQGTIIVEAIAVAANSITTNVAVINNVVATRITVVVATREVAVATLKTGTKVINSRGANTEDNQIPTDSPLAEKVITKAMLPLTCQITKTLSMMT